MLASLLLRPARRILLTVLLGGLLGATLVRMGPGFGVDERELDSRLSVSSQPAAVIALVFLWLGPWIGAAARWAIALVVFPHVYRYAKNQLVATSQAPHVVAAQAKGLSSWRVLWAHIFIPAAPQLAALAGISVSLAFGASIPIEVICDSPGVGQLAWRAALDRDLPLLVTITVLVALLTLVVNSLADLALAAWNLPARSAA